MGGLLASFLGTHQAIAACTPAPSGLISWWPAESSAADIISTNSGILQGGATAIATGMVAQAFSFDGTNGYVQIPDSPSLRPTNLTVECWVRFSALDSFGSGAAQGVQYIVFKQNSRSSSFEGFDLGKKRIAGGDVFKFIVTSAAGASVSLQSTTMITAGLWYHIAGVRGTNFTQLYVNGHLEAQGSVSFPQDYGNFPLYFGTTGESWDRKLKGNLDEVSLYNRALSSNEIAAIHAAGAAGKCKGPIITLQPQSQSVTPGSNVTFTTAATGFGTLHYQWRFNANAINGAANTSLTLSNVQPSSAGDYSVLVTNALGSAVSAAATLTVAAPPALLINVDFGAGTNTTKTGPAALRQAANDFWNFYTRDGPGGGWLSYGTLVNLKQANGADTQTGMIVENAPGAWALGSSDPMYDSYIYPFGAGSAIITITNLLPGTYHFYIYSGDGNMQLVSGGTDSGIRTCVDSPVVNPPVWQEGRQFVAVRNVAITNAAQPVTLTVRAGIFGYAIISGLQVACNLPPWILQQPSNIVAAAGSTVTLQTAGDGATSVGYQWYFNGSALSDGGRIAGASSATLTLSNAQTNDTGSYFVVLNSGGSTTSLVATVQVGLPPTIYQPPTNQTKLPGDSAQFVAGVSGTPPLAFQWLHDGIPLTNDLRISGSTTTNLSIQNLVVTDDGNYVIVASNLFGTVSSPAATLSIIAPPIITQQPVPTTAIAGISASLRVTASGGGPLIYQWMKDGTNLPGPNSNIISWYAIQTNDAGLYSVVVSNPYGQTNSDTVPLSVVLPTCLEAPTGIVSWWPAQSTSDFVDGNYIGGPTSYHVGMGMVGDAYYFNGGDLASLVDTDNLKFTNSFTIEGWINLYFFPAANSSGPDAAILIRSDDRACYDPYYLGISHNGSAVFHIEDAAQTIPCGQNLSAGGLSLNRWYHLGAVFDADSGSMKIFINGALATQTNTTIRPFRDLVPSLHPGVGIGNYANYSGSAPFNGLIDELAVYSRALSAGEILSIYNSSSAGKCLVRPTILQQPQSSAVVVGSNATFQVSAAGSHPLSYQWLKNGVPLTNDGHFSGVDTPLLSISVLQTNDAAGYQVAITNSYAAITSAVAVLNVLTPPVIIAQPYDRTVAAGAGINLFVLVSGSTPLYYQWQRDETNLVADSVVTGVTNLSLVFNGIRTNDSGAYRCLISNVVAGVTSVVANLTVLRPPAITLQPTNQIASLGSSVGFVVQATGEDPLSYQWLKDGLPLTNGGRISGADGPTLSIANVQLSDYGSYRVVITNVVGTVSSLLVYLQEFSLTQVGFNFGMPDSRNIEINSPYAIMTEGVYGMQVFDINNPAAPSVVATYPAASSFGLCTKGQLALVAATTVLRVIDLSNPRAPFHAGGYTNFNSFATDVRISGSFAFVVGLQGFMVFDLRVPAQPALMASLPTSVVGQGVALRIQGNYAYLASSSATPSIPGLIIVDISNPAAPVRRGIYSTTPGGQGVQVSGNLAYLADGTGGLVIVDVSDPAHPARLGAYTNSMNAAGVCITNQLAFVADSNSGVTVLDVSNPAQPVRVASSVTPGIPRGIQVAGPYVFVAAGGAGLRILTGFPTSATDLPATNLPPSIVRDPVNVSMMRSNLASLGPIVEGTLPLTYQWYRDGVLATALTNSLVTYTNAQPPMSGQYFAVISNAFGVVTSSVAKLDVWPVTNVGHYFSGSQRDNPTSIDTRGQFAYLADANLGMTIVDLSVPANPRRVGNYLPKPGNAAGVKVRGNLVYLADGSAGLDIIDVSDPVNPVRVGGYDTTGSSARLDLVWPLAYVADGSAGLQIIDVTAPTAPVRLGGYDTPGTAANVRIADQLAFVADTFALRILNVSNAAAPVQVGAWTNTASGGVSGQGSQILSVTPYGTNAFVGGDPTTDVRAVNISAPDNPYQTWAYDLVTSDGACRGSRVAGDFAYAASGNPSFGVFNLKDPAMPLFAGKFGVGAIPTDIQTLNGYALVAAGLNGLVMLSGFPATNLPPAILDQPLSRTVRTGTNVSLAVLCDGSLPMRFQWYLDGLALAGRTNSWLAFTNTQPSNSGPYQVVATNNFGAVTSAVATLTVLPPAVRLVSLGQTTNGFRFTFTSLAGVIYIVEFTESFPAGTWTELERRVGVGGLETVTDPSPMTSQRFYRVRALYAPPPRLRSFSWTGSAVNFGFPTVSGAIYVVQFKDHLEDSVWSELFHQPGDGSPITVSDSNPSGPSRFYRVKVQ